MRFVRIRLALHVGIEKAGATCFEAYDWIGGALVRISRVFMVNVRVRHQVGSQPFDDRRILDNWRHRDMRRLNGLDSWDVDDALKKFLKRRCIRLEVWQLLVKEHVLR